MTELMTLGGAGVAQHPATVGDLLKADGGLLRRRGKAVYESDFDRRGYDGWIPVYNAGGSESVRAPLGLVDYPRKALRIAAAVGNGQPAAGAIVRLERPWRHWTDQLVSVSFKYAVFAEYAPGTSLSSAYQNPLTHIGSGLDTQSWIEPGQDRHDRQFFQVTSRRDDRSGGDPYNGDYAVLRYISAAGNILSAGSDASILYGTRLPGNENKTDEGYIRNTFRPGPDWDYVEAQAGGSVRDVRDIVPADARLEVPQFSTDRWINGFRGGMNPFLTVQADQTIPGLVAAGIYAWDIVVTVGDVLA